MLKTGLPTGQLDICSLNIKLETIKLNNGSGMKALVKFIMLNLQITPLQTTEENLWLLMLELLPPVFLLNSQKPKENGSSIK